MKRRYRLWIGLPLIVIAVVALAVAFWPRSPRLQLFTTSPIVLRDKTVRFQVLALDGWIEDSPQIVEPLHTSLRPTVWYIALHPRNIGQGVPGWLPRWLSRIVVPEPEFAPCIILTYNNTWFDEMPCHVSEEQYGTRAKAVWLKALRCVRTDTTYSIEYRRTDRTAFEATYRQVCASLRVIHE